MRHELFSLWRGNHEENLVHGEIVVTDPSGVRFQTGNPGSYPIRSLLKPFQFYATDLPVDAVEKTRYAPCMGSIVATEAQTEQLKKWYASPELKKLSTHLKVPATFPGDETNRVLLKKAGAPKSTMYHWCFSKHMAILESCERNGWDLDSYAELSHPYQKKLMSALSQLTHFEINDFALDGCTLPTPAMPLAVMAKLYESLATAKDETPFGKIRRTMMANPEWMAGPKRLETEIMKANSGKVIVKSGADGLLAILVVPTSTVIVVKIAPGLYPNLMGLAATPILRALGLNAVSDEPQGQKIDYKFKFA